MKSKGSSFVVGLLCPAPPASLPEGSAHQNIKIETVTKSWNKALYFLKTAGSPSAPTTLSFQSNYFQMFCLGSHFEPFLADPFGPGGESLRCRVEASV